MQPCFKGSSHARGHRDMGECFVVELSIVAATPVQESTVHKFMQKASAGRLDLGND
jgi:hypothetical protein